MKKLGLFTLFPIVVTTLSRLLADNHAQARHLDNRISALEQRKAEPTMILSSAMPHLKQDKGIALDVEFLYLKPNVKGINLGEIQEISSLSGPIHQDYVFLDWDMYPGARAFLGFRPGHDEWEIRTVWTYLHAKAKKKETPGDELGVYPNPDLPNFEQVDQGFIPLAVLGKWRLNFNQVDLEVSRANAATPWLSFCPYAGLRSLWFYQNLNIFYLGGEDEIAISSRMSSDYWGMGPKLGLDTKWGFGNGVSLYADITGALLWGFFKTHSKAFDAMGHTYDAISHEHTDILVLDFTIGISYGTPLADGNCHLGLKAGWEHHLYYETTIFGGTDTPFGSAILQGLVLGAKLDF